MPEPDILIDGLIIGESPRWHEGRLWFASWGVREIVAVDLAGKREVVGQGTTDGAVWTAADWRTGTACVRVREGGEVLDRVALDRSPFACMLGGADGRTLFIMAADWRTQDSPGDNIQRLTTGPRTGQVLTVPAPAPGVGWP